MCDYQVVKRDACILVHELCLRKLIEKNVNVIDLERYIANS